MINPTSRKAELPTFQDGTQDELVYQSERVRLFRRRAADGSVVLCQQPLGAGAERRLRHELGILARLTGVEGVSQRSPLSGGGGGGGPPGVIALADSGGVPLAQLPARWSSDWGALLRLAQALGRILASVHRRGVVHRQLSPGTILITGPRQRPVLTQFELASTGDEEPPRFALHGDAGSLPYLAPEQTGRTGRAVDQRADLYALGATLYELACGRPPFADSDPLALLHDLLARVAVPLWAVNPDAPAPLCEIVQRLLEKEPDRRYQSADGLVHDLARLEAQLARGEHGSFPLGERDFPLRFATPSRLVGHDVERDALRRALESTCHGAQANVLISGAAGTGKSALVGELRSLAIAHGGWFVTGKFDPHRRDLPSNAVYQAMRTLGRLLLVEPEAELAALRARILAALGPNAGMITALLPEFALLLGVEPDLDSGDSLAAEARLVQAGCALVGAIASPARPLVLVVDDLQWAAMAAIRYLDTLVTDGRLRGLCLVGAYRGEELNADHPLSALLSRWRRLGAEPLQLRLSNLSTAEVSVLLGELLRLAPEPAARLAALLVERTHGNPYDTLELVNALRRDGALVPGEQGFVWDDATIRGYVGQGDVLDLLAARIERLPPQTRDLVDIMACLGGALELSQLEVASGSAAAQLEQQLAPALEDGLVVMQPGGALAARFRHHRVQQAAFDRLAPAQRQRLHLALARRLADVPELGAIAAEQYLPVVDELQDAVERRRVAGLLRSAAVDTRLVNAPLSERFLAAALGLLGALEAAEDTPLRSALAIERHAVLWRLRRFREADEVYRALAEQSDDALELAEAASLQVSSLTGRGRQAEALALGLGLLARLGLPAPAREQLGVEVERGLDALCRWVDESAEDDDLARPESRDPRLVACAKLINRTIVAAFFGDPLTMAWLFCVCQRMWVEHGPSAALVGPLSSAAFVAVGHGRPYRTAHEAVRRVLAVSEARGFEPESSQSRMLFAATCLHWRSPLEEAIHHAQRARERSLLAGDLQMACFAYIPLLLALLDCAPTLDGAAAEIELAIAFAARAGDDHSAASFGAQRQLVRALRGQTAALGSFGDAAFDEPAYVAAHAANPAVFVYFCSARALCAAIFADPTQLIAQAATTFSLLPFIQANYNAVLTYLLQALALAERLRASAPEAREPLLAELDRCRAWLAARAQDAAFNFSHLSKLVEAERAWAIGDPWAAAAAFDAALCELETRTRPWHHALIAERAGLFHLAHDHVHTGRALLTEARRLYAAWGAHGKVQALEQTHAFLRGPSGFALDAATEPSSVSADAIDVLAVLRASQALSSETKLDRLKLRVVELLCAITGATTVHMVLWRDDFEGWFLSDETDESALSLPLEQAGARRLLPLSPFRYVERTRQPLLVEDATRDDRFARDPYFTGLERCSLLAVPIVSQGVVRVVLVLENRLSRGAFSVDRLSAVMLIAGQLAVSLDNALLYASLEQKVIDRTAELEDIHRRLLVASHQAGMAAIASNVLHNVGNALNSVNVSATLVADNLRNSKIASLARVLPLLREHEHELGAFFASDPRGRQLPSYLAQLYEALAAEQETAVRELGALRQNVDHVRAIVASQQAFACTSTLKEEVDLRELVEESLGANRAALSSHTIELSYQCQALPRARIERHKLLQIVAALLRNALRACDDSGRADKLVRVRLTSIDGHARVSVSDNGAGFSPEEATRIFQHRGTLRGAVQAFDLHAAALAAKELGASLRVHSDGPGHGATFTLDLPR